MNLLKKKLLLFLKFENLCFVWKEFYWKYLNIVEEEEKN